MNSSGKRKTRSLPTEPNSQMASISTQREVKTSCSVPKNPPDPIIEQTSASNPPQRRSLRTTTQRNGELMKSDKVTESTVTSQDDGETVNPAKRHNTRLRNSIHKVKQNIEIKYDNYKEDKEKMAFVDTCARELAEMDNDSFQRCFFRDANRLFERLVLPMTFPWNHKAQRVEQVLRALPCDIDEMLALQTEHDSDNDNEEDELNGDGKMVCHRSPQDKGVLELRHVRSAKRRRQHITMGKPNSVPHVNEFAFRMYQEVQSRKHHKEESEPNTPRSLLSIQCNGVSSEASIFKDVPDGKAPLLLPAMQPRDVSKGKRMSVEKAKELSHQLGSYDCRYGLPEIPDEREQSGRRRRVFAGRTRTIWTRREDDNGKSASPSARPTYASIITGETLPAGLHKRPVPVKVGLKVDGKVVTVDKRITENGSDTLALALKNGEEYQVSHEADVINIAVEGLSKPSNDGLNKKKSSNPTQSAQRYNDSRRRSR